MTVKQYTREEISKWDTKKENVFIIDNVVYNVTEFLDEHPGGHEVLVNLAGKDASEDFDDVGHSLDAKELMKKYVVGELVEADRVQVQKRHVAWEDSKVEGDTGFTSSWKFPVLLGIVVTVLYSYLFG
ncbi:cytochrome b5-like [Trichoplusia ni]|uniref:Cytochrome b5-like n=1 Tax=Trichoplusia ni TaxID=7111 RepID=A0A7E5WAK0_TRINI|nr:cytochrome b5-like [Trichoplusia ni]